MRSLHRHALPAIAGASLLLFASAAYAQQEPIVVHGPKIPHGHEKAAETVSYGDIDIAHPDGAAALEKRLKSAVDHVCGGPRSKLQHYQRTHYDACSKASWANAKSQMDHAVAAAKAGR